MMTAVIRWADGGYLTLENVKVSATPREGVVRLMSEDEREVHLINWNEVRQIILTEEGEDDET